MPVKSPAKSHAAREIVFGKKYILCYETDGWEYKENFVLHAMGPKKFFVPYRLTPEDFHSLFSILTSNAGDGYVLSKIGEYVKRRQKQGGKFQKAV